MASLTIRNISVTPLELTLVERFEAESAGGGGFSVIFKRLLRVPLSLLGIQAGATDDTAGVVPRPGTEPTARDEIQGVAIGPFETRKTEISAPDATSEVVRLTFVASFPGADGAAAATKRSYTVDVPAPSTRSIELTPVEGGDDKAAFTAVYRRGSAHLSIMSSAALSSWMATVDGAWPVSSLSLPGTHNSPAYHHALPSVRCQAVDVRKQLDNGVRFLDVRVSVSPTDPAGQQPHADPRLALVHSAFPVSLTGTRLFSELYETVCAFLEAHPTETVLISVKREGTGSGTDADLARQLRDHYVQKAEQKWFTQSRIPSLDEVRGKIILIRRFGVPDDDEAFRAGYGVDASAWPDNCSDGTSGSGLLRLQDFYDVTKTANIDTKITYVRSLLEKAAQTIYAKSGAVAAAAAPGMPAPPMFVNFLTGSNFFNTSCWPENVAARVNPTVIDHLCVHHNETEPGDGSTGIVVTDWVGYKGDWDLVRCVVAWNARLQLKA